MRFVLLSAALFFTASTDIPLAAAETFTVRHVEGENTVLQAGQTGWHKVQAGTTLHLGDHMVCSEGGLMQIECARGVLELSGSSDLLIRSMSSAESEGSVTLELASGQIKGDWSSDRGNPLTVQVPGAEFKAENGFFSLWIYSLLGRPYTRVDLFRGEGFLQETTASVPLAVKAGQHMTTGGLQSSQGPRATPVIPGFDTFEFKPLARQPSSKDLPKQTDAVMQGARA